MSKPVVEAFTVARTVMTAARDLLDTVDGLQSLTPSTDSPSVDGSVSRLPRTNNQLASMVSALRDVLNTQDRALTRIMHETSTGVDSAASSPMPGSGSVVVPASTALARATQPTQPSTAHAAARCVCVCVCVCVHV